MLGTFRLFTTNHFRVCVGIIRAHYIFSLHYIVYNLKQDHRYYDMHIAIVKKSYPGPFSFLKGTSSLLLKQVFHMLGSFSSVSLACKTMLVHMYSITFQTSFPLSQSHRLCELTILMKALVCKMFAAQYRVVTCFQFGPGPLNLISTLLSQGWILWKAK